MGLRQKEEQTWFQLLQRADSKGSGSEIKNVVTLGSTVKHIYLPHSHHLPRC